MNPLDTFRDPRIDAFLAEAMPPEEANALIQRVAVLSFPAGRALLALDRPQRAAAAAEVLLRLREAARASSGTYTFANRRTLLQALALRLVNASAPLEEEEAVRLAEAASQLTKYLFWDAPVGALLKVFEEHVKAHGLSARLREALARIECVPPSPRDKRHSDHLQDLLRGIVREEPSKVEIRPGEAWADALRAELAGLDPAGVNVGQKRAWQDLLLHCQSAKAATPSSKWGSRAEELVRAVGREDFRRIAGAVLSRIGRTGTDAAPLDPEQSDLLRGIVWATASVADQQFLGVLGQTALACFQKIPNHGPRSAKIGNACLHVLGGASDRTAVVQLSRLLLKFRTGSIRQQIEKALNAVSKRTGLTPAELQEISVPRFDMEAVGVRREPIGSFTAEILLNESELRWIDGEGKIQKSVPAAVRSAHTGELAALKKLQKEILGILSIQRDRIDQLYITPAGWDLKTWRERYLDHPLVGVVARRLIWRFGEGAEARLGIAPDGRIVNVRGEPLDGLSPETPVALWHPLESPAEEVLTWRRWLEERRIRQPFKQAHREIYVLTDAERATDTYSNRFAAHIVRQHPFMALCAQRGWRHQFQGVWDYGELPVRALPEHGLQVEFQVEGGGHEEAPTSEAGIFLYLTTGAVRFLELSGAPRSLAEIPPLVFSELMRDCDLFVSVTSIGNDPNWMDQHQWGGEQWQHAAFGEINATARTRHEILGRLLPRLKIAGRCSLTDRFLVVRGDLRTYKIHLGSGNVLMEPNDQYLCIVSGRSTPEIFVPFGGDRTFSIILSKAFLLAEDTKISDPTILRQIRR